MLIGVLHGMSIHVYDIMRKLIMNKVYAVLPDN